MLLAPWRLKAASGALLGLAKKMACGWSGSEKYPLGHKIFLPASSLDVSDACPPTEKNIKHFFVFEENSRTLKFFPPLTAPLT
jgi:hypothetical protein